jgi:hypothetical protein
VVVKEKDPPCTEPDSRTEIKEIGAGVIPV